MRKLLIIFLVAIILNGFYAEVKAKNFEKHRVSIKNQQAVGSEYISLKSAKINGKLPFLTKTNLLFKLIGKPKHLVKPDLNEYCGSFYNKPFKQAKVEGVEAEIYGDTAVVRSVNFKKSPNLSLKTPHINLNYTTGLVDLKRVFPISVKAQTTINDTDFGKVLAVHIALEKKSEDFWLLIFQHEKLVRIDYYSPC